MPSCLSSRACGFNLEHMVKWPCSNSSRTSSNSSSPSSTLTELSNSPVPISDQKTRTPRKRPNQTYNEAAALLSMASPNIFKIKHLSKRTSNPFKFIKNQYNFFNEPPELISPVPLIENSGFLLRQRIMNKPCSSTDLKFSSSCQIAGEIESITVSSEISDGCLDDFNTESILIEEIEQGIDSIMRDSQPISEKYESSDNLAYDFKIEYDYPMGLGFGVRNGVRALKKADHRNWWKFPMVDVVNTSPAVTEKCEKYQVGNKKKKKVEELGKSESGFRHRNFNSGDMNLNSGNEQRIGLKLDYDGVLNGWADKGLPVPEEISPSSSPASDINVSFNLFGFVFQRQFHTSL
ncbi:hypothetical protein R6Q57_028279 [Mikania cordata]